MKKFDIAADGIETIKQENSARKFVLNALKDRHRMMMFKGNFVYLQTINNDGQELIFTTVRGRALEICNSPVTPHMLHRIIFISEKDLHINRDKWSMLIDGGVIDCKPYWIDKFIEIVLA